MCKYCVYVITLYYIQYIQGFEGDPYHFNNTETNATIVCKEYADVKTYQYMLYQFLNSQATANVSNATILSIVYMLQQAGESLQEIQVYTVCFKL